MSITNAKHIVEEIDGIRCTIVEKGLSDARLGFLKDLLEFNHLEVKVAEEAPSEAAAGETPEDKDTSVSDHAEKTYTLGVTDIVFNPVFAIYERRLKTRGGDFVTPAIWNQKTTQFRADYWMEGKRNKS